MKPAVTDSAARLIADLASRGAVEASSTYTFSGWTVRLESNDPALVAKLDAYFNGFAATPDAVPDDVVTALEAPADDLGLAYTARQPDPGKKRIKEEYVDFPDGRAVRKRLTGMLFLFGGGRHLAYGPCLANDNQVINYVISRYIQWRLRQGSLLLHAAAVRIGGRGVAFAGFAGMGKSTLALHLLSRGAEFVSNDRLMVPADGTPLLYGVPKLPRINPGTALNNPDLAAILTEDERAKFSSLPVDELWHLEQKYDVFIDRAFGPDRFHLDAPFEGLVLLNWKRDDGPLKVTEVDLTARPDLFPAFTKSTGLFFEPSVEDPEPDHGNDAYLDALRGRTIIELSGGVDFDAAADFCLARFGR